MYLEVTSITEIRKTILFVVFIIANGFVYAQVGIGTTNPHAALEIRSSNQVAPSNSDGILIPRIDNFSGVNPTINQDGMLIFATGNGTPSKGFYYWDSALTNWVLITGISGGGGTGNTLDQAYDQSGAGLGRTINATNGAVRINGDDGFLVTGTFGLGNTIDTEFTGEGTRMFFNPNKSAFRAGSVFDFFPLPSDQWDNTNIGFYSTAFGTNTIASAGTSTAFGSFTTASGNISTAFGSFTTASGDQSTAFGSGTIASGGIATVFGNQTTASGTASIAFGSFTNASGSYATAFGFQSLASGITSTALGRGVIAPSYGEIAVGIYNTTYTPFSTNNFYVSDRLFTIGNGTTSSGRSNALTIYKNGLMNINDAYNMPLTDGISNQVMTTNGAGVVSFQSIETIYNGNTLDEAYNEGGLGAGRIINATNGPVEIQNNGGLIVGSNSQSHMLYVDGAQDEVGVGTNSPTATLSVNGNANKPGGGTWAVFSDSRLKKNVANYQEGIEFILKVNPVSFSYNEKMNAILGDNIPLNGKVFYGVIAQDLKVIAPDMVRDVAVGTKTYLEVDPNKFTYALINAVKQQQDTIVNQQERLNQLENEFKELKAFIANWKDRKL